MNIRLDLESLRAFRTVAQAGGVTQAAQRLNLTQSAVSHKMKRLEEKVGAVLFQRKGGVMLPTEDGHYLLRYAEKMLALHDEAVARFWHDDLFGSIELGITEYIPIDGVAKILARFSNAFPNLSINTRAEQSLVLNDWLEQAEVDLALVQILEQNILPSDHVLWRDQIVWVQSETFDLPPDGDIPFISFDQRGLSMKWAIPALAEMDRKLKVVFECPGVEGVRAAVRSGLGLALLTERKLRPGMVLSTSDLPQPPRVAYVARTSSEEPTVPVSALLAAIEDEFFEDEPLHSPLRSEKELVRLKPKSST